METANPEPMSVVPLQPDRDWSPLAAARLHRQLTVAEAARRAGITEDEARWLEEGRVYRFRSTDAAMLALLLYATGLGIDHREAKHLAGLPLPPKPFEPGTRARLIAVAAIAALLAALLTAVGFSKLGDTAITKPIAPPGSTLPAPWQIRVDVFDGAQDIVRARTLASRIGSYGYSIHRVRKATQSNYRHTIVFYEPGGQSMAVRLARRLGVATAPLPGGKDKNRLVVIVGKR
jgi:transcriptional regulator with XRE-family HTH domain